MLPTLTEALRRAKHDLSEAGIPSPDVDARLLLCAATGLERVALILEPDLPLSTEAAARFGGFLKRRLLREPVSRILGSREFWGLNLRITPDVLDPRPDTETLVEAVLAAVEGRRSHPWRILDLGTGSGAILCALLHDLPDARGWAVDRSVAACRVAQSNLAACGLAGRSLVLQGDWGSALAGDSFDLVVSNPPYIETEAISGLDQDVREHDPSAALDGGADGLTAYRILAAELPRFLVRGGVAAFEVGQGQDAAVSALMTSVGLIDLATRRDLAGIKRVVMGRR